MHSSSIFRRKAMLLLGCVGALMAAGPAPAQTLPTGPVKIVNAFPPGGPSDIISRLVADKLAAVLRQSVVVENKPGAGGNIAADQVARAAPDGQTILSGIDTTFTINPAIYKSLGWRLEDLQPLLIMASSGLLLGVNPALGVTTPQQLIDMGRSKQGLSFSSGSNGSPGHLAAEILGESTGVKVLHVPYKGNSPAVLAVLSGEVDGGILATPGMIPHVKAGKVVPLAVTSRQRSPLAPDVPTTAELGLKDLQVEVLYVAMIPTATPPAMRAALAKAFADALAQPDVEEKLAQLDLFVENVGGKTAEDMLAGQRDRYTRIIRSTGMTID